MMTSAHMGRGKSSVSRPPVVKVIVERIQLRPVPREGQEPKCADQRSRNNEGGRSADSNRTDLHGVTGDENGATDQHHQSDDRMAQGGKSIGDCRRGPPSSGPEGRGRSARAVPVRLGELISLGAVPVVWNPWCDGRDGSSCRAIRCGHPVVINSPGRRRRLPGGSVPTIGGDTWPPVRSTPATERSEGLPIVPLPLGNMDALADLHRILGVELVTAPLLGLPVPGVVPPRPLLLG